MNDPKGTAEQCREILNRFIREDEHAEVILLRGTGHDPKPEEDKKLIEQTLKKLGCVA
jgi:hypothetical protein